MSTTKSELSELLPNLNLREELLTVGDRGDLVVASEQLQNLGMEVDNRELYTPKTYEYVISLKSYLKQLDLEFYNYLQVGDYCGTPPVVNGNLLNVIVIPSTKNANRIPVAHVVVFPMVHTPSS